MLQNTGKITSPVLAFGAIMMVCCYASLPDHRGDRCRPSNHALMGTTGRPWGYVWRRPWHSGRRFRRPRTSDGAPGWRIRRARCRCWCVRSLGKGNRILGWSSSRFLPRSLSLSGQVWVSVEIRAVGISMVGISIWIRRLVCISPLVVVRRHRGVWRHFFLPDAVVSSLRLFLRAVWPTPAE